MINKIVNAMSTLGLILLVGLVIFIVVELISRNVFNFGIPGAVEITEYLIAYIAFLGAPWILKEDGHVKISLVIDRLSSKKRTAVLMTSSIIGFIATSIISVVGFLQVISLYNRNVLTETVLGLPLALLIAIVPISFLLIAAQFIIKFSNARENFRRMEKGDV
ncbi:TRAP transporter small permease [Salicibibacter cibarius]|uniref:TRAP transporter small permease n=1 Tax=Salicibibacter cibarius TaxID=2743000 RepID=A0A7T7CA69_9BACI|nr:TRAP transporter small permease [Salicibibacter cibarius]QQK74404.1 TRAP transporter small permease [Salicibibacter cibarius]